MVVGGWELLTKHSYANQKKKICLRHSLQTVSETDSQPSTSNPVHRVFLPPQNSRANLSSNLDGTTHNAVSSTDKGTNSRIFAGWGFVMPFQTPNQTGAHV